MKVTDALTVHELVKEKQLKGRYILPKKLDDILNSLPDFFRTKTIGFSVENRPIKSVTFGSGKTKIFMWSQMHGNESTTTKSLVDFFNFMVSPEFEKVAQNISENCSFFIIPMLNPDGSQVWKRENAHGVDLNRDAQDRSEPESQILISAFEEFQPDYCFNLHGQRTIYGFEDTELSSVLSFLAPAAEVSRAFTFSRKRATSIISHIHKVLDPKLSGQIGLYDDTYNENCVGDYFQSREVPTVLFEAGHYPEDYDRETTRTYVFAALLAAIEGAMGNVVYSLEDYQAIPQHSKCFCDVHKKTADGVVRLQYEEVLKNGAIEFRLIPFTEVMGSGLYSHEVQ